MAYIQADFVGTYWRILDGDFYVSSLGDDTNGDGSPSNPLKTIQEAITRATSPTKVVVGTGSYSENISGLNKNDIHIIADGIVVVTGKLTNLGDNCSVEGFVGNSFTITKKCEVLNNCHFYNGGVSEHIGTIKNCTFLESFVRSSSSKLHSCTFYQAQVGDTNSNNFTEILDSHFGRNTSLLINSTLTNIFDYCNIQNCKVQIDSLIFVDSVSIHATFNNYQANGISISPEFNNVGMQDFSLHKDSGLKNTGSTGKQIGAIGVNYSLHNYTNRENSNPFGNVGLTDVYFDSNGDYYVSSGVSQGKILTLEYDLGSVLNLQEINVFAEQVFETPPQNAVVDYDNAFNHPNFLSFEMRFSNVPLTNEPYHLFAWNKVPSIDANGKSNGLSDYDNSTAHKILARYVQFQITLFNNSDLGKVVFHGMSIGLKETELSINIQDTNGYAVDGANIEIDLGSSQISGSTDNLGCYTYNIQIGIPFNIKITKQFYNDIVQKAQLISKRTLNGPLSNFACIVVDSNNQPIQGALVTISSSLNNFTGTTNIDGIFDGIIETNYVNNFKIEKTGYVTYNHIFNPFIKFSCGSDELIIATIIELNNI